jgi:hypothetical protein
VTSPQSYKTMRGIVPANGWAVKAKSTLFYNWNKTYCEYLAILLETSGFRPRAESCPCLFVHSWRDRHP